MPETKTRTFLALKEKNTGALARIAHEDHCCNDYYRLTKDENYPVFEAASVDVLANVLFENTPSYNSRRDQPGWGDFREGELVPASVTVTTEVADIELPKTLNVETLQVRTIPMLVARKYVGREFERIKEDDDIVFWLVQLPEGETLASVQAFVGSKVCGGDRWSKRMLYAAVPVPEDYVSMTKPGREHALFIGSGIVY